MLLWQYRKRGKKDNDLLKGGKREGGCACLSCWLYDAHKERQEKTNPPPHRSS